jgi:hypothetical protein
MVVSMKTSRNKSRLVLLPALLTILFAVFADQSFAATYYISTTGSDSANGQTTGTAWATFAHAWDVLQPGDTLILMNGTYYQSIVPDVRNGEPNPAIDTGDYATYPLDDPQRTLYYITIKAQYDGKAVIDGQGVREPVVLGHWDQGGIGHYFILEGLVAKNSSESVYFILSHDVIVRRCSGYDASTDKNAGVFSFWATGSGIADPANVLVEDCIAAGTGRKMFMFYDSYVNLIFRRNFAAWDSWRNNDTYDPNNWPWADGIECYNWNQPAGVTNCIVENNIVYGRLANYGFSLSPNPALTQGNRFLGDIAVKVGMKWNGSPMLGELRPDEGGDLIPNMSKDWPCPNPAKPTQACTPFTQWQSHRAGFVFGTYSNPEYHDNVFRDLFAWGNAGAGLSIGEPPESQGWTANSSGNVLDHITLANNSIGDPQPWEKIQGYPNLHEYSLDMIQRAGSTTNLYIQGDGRYSNPSVGARLRYRYVDGILMDGTNGHPAQELWPWPMEQRIKDELGINVTCEIGDLVNRYTATPLGIDPADYCDSAGATQPELSVDDSNASRSSLVNITVSFSPGTNDTAGFQFDMTLPSGVTFVDAALGPAAVAADKDITTNPALGRVMVYGFNENAIDGGVVVIATLNVTPDAALGAQTVNLTNLAFTTPDAQPLAGTAEAGSLTILSGTPGDVNNDDSVGLPDLLLVAADLGKTSGYAAAVDLAAPWGRIDLYDLMEVVKNWG